MTGHATRSPNCSDFRSTTCCFRRRPSTVDISTQTRSQISTLLSIKTGGCPEDCAYCPQSVRFDTNVDNENLMSVEDVVAAARNARANGATRFCMGAAYRSPKARQLADIKKMVTAVHELGMETCATLGMLGPEQATELKDAGLDYYNHNLDTSESFYPEIISTRTYRDRLDTLQAVREAGLKVCCGGIIGMGESEDDWVDMLHTLATLPEHPGSVPINQLVQVAGTPLAEERPDGGPLDANALDFVRVIAVARILMPASHVRLSAGRTDMSDEMQALCFHAGANSIFYGDKLLTTPNPGGERGPGTARPPRHAPGRMLDKKLIRRGFEKAAPGFGRTCLPASGNSCKTAGAFTNDARRPVHCRRSRRRNRGGTTCTDRAFSRGDTAADRPDAGHAAGRGGFGLWRLRGRRPPAAGRRVRRRRFLEPDAATL